jgi:hypothetical protein
VNASRLPGRSILSSTGQVLAALLIVAAGLPAAGAQESTFAARLTTVPIDAAMQTRVTGRGQAVAILDGSMLSISGTFEGLQRPATTARLHIGELRGLRGEALFDISVTKASHGSLEASLELSPELVDALKSGRIYIQIHSESAPEGNLWGWLLDPR